MSAAPATVRYTVDEDEDLKFALIDALSVAKEQDITTKDTLLYHAIDPDALESVFNGRQDDKLVEVEFATHDAIVVVRDTDTTTIEVQDFGPEQRRK